METRAGGRVNGAEGGAGDHEFLKPDEVGRLLRCGRTKIYELLQTGEIPSYRVGKNRIVRRTEVLAWLNRHQEGPDHSWSGTAFR